MKSQFKTFRKLDKIELRNKIVLTVFENYRKSVIQHCERSELLLQSILKMPKMVNFDEFFNKNSCKMPKFKN